jgi:hypothetical protein
VARGRPQATHHNLKFFRGAPHLDSIADLGRIGGMLAPRGHSAADIEGFYYGNFVGFLRRTLPA